MEIGTPSYNKAVINLLNQYDYQTVNVFMDKEIEFLLKVNSGCTRTIHSICYLLSLYKHHEDIWKIWTVKCANQDTYYSIAISWIYFFFDSIENTIEYVKQSGHPETDNLLKRIQSDQRIWLTEDKLKKLPRRNSKVSKKFILYG